MKKIETKTKTGTPVTIELKNNRPYVTAVLPQHGEFSDYAVWGCTPDGKQYGVRFESPVTIGGKRHNLVLAVGKDEWDPAETESKRLIKAEKDKKKQERIDYENSLKQHRVLARSGSYLMNEAITTVCVLEDSEQEKYSDWCRGRVAMGSVQVNAIKISLNDSPTAKDIAHNPDREADLFYPSGESALYIITPEQESAIRSECNAAHKARDDEKAKKEREKQAKIKAAKEKIENLNISIEVKKEGKISGGDGPDYYADVVVTDKATGESLPFSCRNIFDFGYVVNPAYEIAPGLNGGVQRDGRWQTFDKEKGWVDVREMRDFEKRATEYLRLAPPISTGIRM